MLTLIKAILLYAVIPFFITVLIAAGIATRTIFENNIPIGIPAMFYRGQWFLLLILPFFAAGVGASQMYSDRNKGISTFLATMATTRGQIISARIAAGLLGIAIVIVPLILTEAVLLVVYPRLVPVESMFLWRIFIAAFLINAAAYSVGLLMGWNTRKHLPVLGTLVLCIPLIGLLIVKGFSLQASLLLLLVIAACLTRVWQKYLATSL